MIVGRLDEGSNRWYVDPADPDTRYESVTTILSRAESLPWLAPWAAKLAGEYVAANLDELLTLHAAQGPGAVVTLVKDQAQLRRELKADIGSHAHSVIEALLLDGLIPDVPEHLVDVEIDGERVDHDEITDGFLAFVEDFDYRHVLAEATVANALYGYAGTMDSVGDFPRPPVPGARRGLIDVKTGQLKVHARAQLAAYSRATDVWLDSLGNRMPMPAVDFAAVLHLRREFHRGYRLVPMIRNEGEETRAFRWFTACQAVLRHQDAQEKVPRGAWYPPRADGSQPPTPLEDVEHAAFRCRKALLAAGIADVEELAAFTAADLRGVKGVGPKAVVVCAEVLAGYGLALAQEQS